MQISSDISHNITSYSFKALDYNNHIGVHLLPKHFILAGSDDGNNWNSLQEVEHSDASTDTSFNAVSPTYTNSANTYYKYYRLVVIKKFDDDDYEDVIARKFVAIGEWVISSSALDTSQPINTYKSTNAAIDLDAVTENKLNITGDVVMKNTATVDGNALVKKDLTVNENALVKKDLTVNEK